MCGGYLGLYDVLYGHKLEREIVETVMKVNRGLNSETRAWPHRAEINMLPTNRHFPRILAPRVDLASDPPFYILEIVLGMLLPVVIHNARNIRPGPTAH